MDPATNEHVRSLRNERDQYADDLTQVEKSFTELHRRYDKLRETTKSHKRNEEKMNEESNDIRRQLRDSHLNFEVRICGNLMLKHKQFIDITLQITLQITYHMKLERLSLLIPWSHLLLALMWPLLCTLRAYRDENVSDLIYFYCRNYEKNRKRNYPRQQLK